MIDPTATNLPFPEPVEGSQKSFRCMLTTIIANSILNLQQDARSAIDHELSPDLVAMHTAMTLRDKRVGKWHLHFHDRQHESIIEGLKLLLSYSSRLERVASMIQSARQSQPKSDERTILSTVVKAVAELFPKLPPDDVLDVLVPEGVTLQRLVPAMQQIKPVPQRYQDAPKMLDVALTPGELKLLAQSTKLLEELRRRDQDALSNFALALYGERLLFCAIRLGARLIEDPQMLADFRAYADPPLDFTPSDSPTDDLRKIATLCLQHDAFVSTGLTTPVDQAKAILRGSETKQCKLRVPFVLGKVKLWLSVDGADGFVQLTTSHETRDQAGLEALKKTLVKAGINNLLSPPSEEQQARNIPTIYLQLRALKNGTRLEEVLELAASLPQAQPLIWVHLSHYHPSSLRLLGITADQIEFMGTTPRGDSEHLQRKLFSEEVDAAVVLAASLKIRPNSSEHNEAQAKIWREAYRDYSTTKA